MNTVFIKVLTPEFHQLVDHHLHQMIMDVHVKLDSIEKFKRLYESELRLLWTGVRKAEELHNRYHESIHSPQWVEHEVELTNKLTLIGSPVVIYQGEEIGIYTLPIFDMKGFEKRTLDLTGLVPSDVDIDSAEAIPVGIEDYDEQVIWLEDEDTLYDPNQPNLLSSE